MKKCKPSKGRQETVSNPYWSRPTLGKSPQMRQDQVMTNNYSKGGSKESQSTMSQMLDRGPVISPPRRTRIGGM